MNLWSLQFRRGSQISAESRSYVTEATRVAKLQSATQGRYSSPHPALVDRAVRDPADSTQIKYVGQQGTPQNPSEALHPTEDLQGNKRPQNYIPGKTNEYIPENWFDTKSVKTALQQSSNSSGTLESSSSSSTS